MSNLFQCNQCSNPLKCIEAGICLKEEKKNSTDTLDKYPTIEDMMFGNKSAQARHDRKKKIKQNPKFYWRAINK